MSKLNKKQIEEMNDKLISRCPHCSEMIGATNRNEFDKFNRILELLEKISSSLDTLVERGNA